MSLGRILSFLLFFLANLNAVGTILVDDNFVMVDSAENSVFIRDNNSTINSDCLLLNGALQPINKVNMGIVSGSTWTKFSIKNSTDKHQKLMLRHPVAGTDSIDVFIYYDSNKSYNEKYELGDLRPQYNRPIQSRASTFPVILEAKQEATIVAKIENKGPTIASFQIYDLQRFSQISTKELLWFGFFTGVLSGLIVYNLIIFFALRRIVFLIYVLYTFFMLIYQLAYSGILYSLDTGISNWFIDRLTWILPMVASAFMAIFPIYFFELGTKTKLAKIQLLLAFLLLAMSCSFLFINGSLFYFITNIAVLFGLSNLVFLIVIGFYMLYLKKPTSIYYLIGQGSIVLSFLVISFFLKGMTSSYELISFIIQIGLMLDAIFISLALGGHIHQIELQRLKNEKIVMLQSRFATLGQVVGNIAHQFKVPVSHIGSLVMQLEATLLNNKNDPVNKSLTIASTLKSSVKFMSNTINEFTNFYKTENYPESFIPEEKINTILELLSAKITNSFMEITINSNNNYKIYNFTHTFAHVVMIIIDNAIDAAIIRKVIEPKIDISINYLDSGKIELTILDNCEGVKIDPLESIFKYSVSDKTNGSGTGLFIAKMFTEERMKGTISAENSNHGAKFTIVIGNLS